MAWYVLFPIVFHHFGWLSPRRAQHGHLAVGFVLVALLLLVSGNFVGLVFALIGASTAMLPPRETVAPVGVAVLLYLGATGLLPISAHYRSLSDTVGPLVSLATSSGIVYALTALIRERIQREHVFRELSMAHQELSEGHQSLHLSAAREADLASLRERNRLAREN